MNIENPSFKEMSSRPIERLQKQAGSIADVAIFSAFEDSNDIRQTLAELED